MPYPSASSDPVPCPPALHCGTTFSLESPFHCNCRVATRSRRNGLPPMTPMAIKRVNLTPNIVPVPSGKDPSKTKEKGTADGVFWRPKLRGFTR